MFVHSVITQLICEKELISFEKFGELLIRELLSSWINYINLCSVPENHQKFHTFEWTRSGKQIFCLISYTWTFSLTDIWLHFNLFYFLILWHFNLEEDSIVRINQTKTSKMLLKITALVLLVQLTNANPAINPSTYKNLFYNASKFFSKLLKRFIFICY